MLFRKEKYTLNGDPMQIFDIRSLATAYKLPVSTTHVLSSGIAGSMVASKGIKNLQGGTIKNILLAWVLTLPVTILLSATLFVFFRWIAG